MNKIKWIQPSPFTVKTEDKRIFKSRMVEAVNSPYVYVWYYAMGVTGKDEDVNIEIVITKKARVNTLNGKSKREFEKELKMKEKNAFEELKEIINLIDKLQE